MTIRYLYGKREYLSGLISGKKLPRLSDISHYKRIENESMRDEEEQKSFKFDKEEVKIKINGLDISSSDLYDHPTMSVPVRHCYCVCFSKCKNDAELFKVFKADVCVEINLDILKNEMDLILNDDYPGSEVIFNDIEYYHEFQFLLEKNSSDLVFYKPIAFIHEQETRLAFFYPLQKQGFKGVNGEVMPFRKEGESLHLEINITDDDPDLKSRCVTGVHYLNAALYE